MKINEKNFWSYVNKTKTCWLWTGYKTGKYGGFMTANKSYLAHRISYFLIKGDIPNGYQIDHLCKVRDCVNPDHLEAVTPRTNVLRSNAQSALNYRKTHCKYGHPFTGKNLYVDPKGFRYCKTCKNRLLRDWRLEKGLVDNPIVSRIKVYY